jgi:GPH family glycoside/pentoside/hexuronide:cation symporter
VQPPSSSSISAKLSFLEKFGFGLGDTASNFVWGTLGYFLMYYYTEIFGISALAAGTLFLFTRSCDGLVDFFMGAIADRTNTRWGKFRPYLLWMSIPLAVVFVLTFTTPDLDTNGKIIYAWVTYSLLMIFYTAINIPYAALSGVMTNDPLDRTSLNSFRMALARIGGLIVTASTLPLIALFGGLPQDFDKTALTPQQHLQASHGYQLTIALFSIVAIVLFLITFLTTKERILPPPAQKTNLLEDLIRLFENRHWVMMFVASITVMTLIIVRDGTLLYYAKYYVGMSGQTISLFGYTYPMESFLLVAGNLGFIPGAMCTRFLVKFIGKKYSYMVTLLGLSLTCFAFYWIEPGQTTLIFVFHALNNFCGGLNAALYFSMIADTADFAEWKFHVRNTGIIFSATTCSQKVGLGIGGFVSGLVLTAFGYQAEVATQTPSAQQGILLMVSLIPAVGYFCIAALMNLYGLDEKFCQTIREDLALRRQ